MLMESQAKFCHPQNISGASQQNSKLRNNWSRRGVVSTTAKNIQNWFKKTLFTPWMHTLKKKKITSSWGQECENFGWTLETDRNGVTSQRPRVPQLLPSFPLISCPCLCRRQGTEKSRKGHYVTESDSCVEVNTRCMKTQTKTQQTHFSHTQFVFESLLFTAWLQVNQQHLVGPALFGQDVISLDNHLVTDILPGVYSLIFWRHFFIRSQAT